MHSLTHNLKIHIKYQYLFSHSSYTQKKVCNSSITRIWLYTLVPSHFAVFLLCFLPASSNPLPCQGMCIFFDNGNLIIWPVSLKAFITWWFALPTDTWQTSSKTEWDCPLFLRYFSILRQYAWISSELSKLNSTNLFLYLPLPTRSKFHKAYAFKTQKVNNDI